jgi:hydrogenase nickel incorporation protein HypB
VCATCGCSDPAGVRVVDPSHDHDLVPGHGHGHGHGHDHSSPAVVDLEQDILAANDRLAGVNRAFLAEHGITAVNLMSSPGSGKTTLLVRTVRDLGGSRSISVIEGDQETLLDAERIGATGARVVQVNTGAGCHLDAAMTGSALRTLDPPDGSLLMVENVGNLVCPALFDLGETARVVIMSVTEGADKPLKYPHMFRTADLVLLNKIDLLPYVDFDVTHFVDCARRAAPGVEVLEVSATRGDGMQRWYDWLDSEVRSSAPAQR